MKKNTYHNLIKDNKIKVFRATKVLTLLISSASLVFGAAYAYAQLSASNFDVRTIHIFPADISADGWDNIETITFQNLDEYALLQEFNSINSATIDTSRANQIKIKSDHNESESVDVQEPTEIKNQSTATTSSETLNSFSTSTDSQLNQAVIVLDGVDGSSTVELKAVPEELVTPEVEENNEVKVADEEVMSEEVPAEASAESEAVPVSSQSTTTVMKRVGSVFALAIEAVTSVFENAPAASSSSDESEVTPESREAVVNEDSEETEQSATSTSDEEEGEVVMTQEYELAQEEVIDEVVQTDSDAVVNTATSTEEIIAESDSVKISSTTAVASEKEVVVETIEPEEEEEEEVKAEVEVVVSEESTESVTLDCESGCTPYVISLSNFGFPLEENVEVSGAQLRMSFAAKTKNTRDHIPMFQIRYSVDGGQSWDSGGAIIIDDEASNSINGGHYLFAIPNIVDQEALNALEVELIYEDNPAVLEDLFVESVWLELFTLEESEDVSPFNLAEVLKNDGYESGSLSGDELTLPDGKKVDFTFTDENEGETLIIKSDKADYVGLTKTTTYFSVTNTSNRSDEFILQTYFPTGVGEVLEVKEYNQNKPINAVIPEYRPFVYNCEAGWEFDGEVEAGSIEELSQQFSGQAAEVETEPGILFALPTTTEEAFVPNVVVPTSSNTTTVLNYLPNIARLLQFSATTSIASSTEVEEDTEVTEVTEVTESDESVEEEVAASYLCRNTNIVRTCDYLEGSNTACHIEQHKVDEHQVTQYKPGWDKVTKMDGDMPKPGLLRRVVEFIGFGPDRKEVKEGFEVRTHSQDKHLIEPGETKYFEMEISFPPFSSGEYWIEAIGDREYGLLDPFWSSQWRYRMPIEIDNLSGATSTEQQVFLELDSTQADFWTNVQSDGGDVRFITETVGDDASTWYDENWNSRLPITIASTLVDEDLTDFPVYVNLTDLGEDFFTSVQASGADIRITGGDRVTELPYELVNIDTSAQTGELHFKAAALSSTTDSVFYIYYGNGGISAYAETDPFGAQNVWTNNYLAVYHLEENASGAGNLALYTDSTSNEFDGDDQLTSTGKGGKVGRGQEFEQTASEFIDLPEAMLNGQGDVTLTYWMQTTKTGQQAIVSAPNSARNNEYLIFQSNQTALAQWSGSGNTAFGVTGVADNNWRHFMMTLDDAADGGGVDQVSLFINGVADNENPRGLTTGTLLIESIYLGQEQDSVDDCCNAGQAFDGFLDEMRFASVVRTEPWAKAEYQNQNNSATFYGTSTPESFIPTTFVELDYWIQHFDSGNEKADIWVQLDELVGGATSTLYVYYGNATADTTSDEYAPFTYSTSTDLYYVVNDGQSTDIVVYSYVDDNEVSIDGGTPVTLQSGETTSFTSASYASTSVVSATGPITTRTSDDSSEPVIPLSFATTTLVIPSTRGTESVHTFAPFADAFVETFDGADTVVGASGTTTFGSTAVYTDANGNGTVVEASNPILVYFDTPDDSLVLYPPTLRDLFGIHSNQYYYTTTQGGTAVDIFCSGGGTGSDSGITRGAQDGNTVCAAGAEGTGDAVRLANQTAPMTAIQQADSSGSESSIFLPEPEFGTRYIVPQAAEYVSIACSPRFGTTTIEVQSAVGATLSTGTCTPAGSLPGTLNFTPGTAYSAGSQIVSTNGVPFYLYYEFDENNEGEETNTWSAVQAKKFNSLYIPSTFGAQEENEDAQYSQLNYRWYENTNAITPTTPWDIDGTPVAEGAAIADQGAINPGDELRLRMNLLAFNGTGTVDSAAFTLQYAQAETCSAVIETNWFELGDVGSTTAAFAGLNNTAVGDGTVLASTLLSDSDINGTYEEENNSATLPNEVGNGEAVEFDWSITSVNTVANAEYCFRMTRSTAELLTTYVTYPQILTAGPPGATALQTPFDNEHATSTSPDFTFVAADVGGDALGYEIEIATDITFGTIIETADSDADPFDFENVTLASDKAPFNNGQIVRYLIQSSLTNGQTYWWRVRAIDPGGSNTYGAFSAPRSFTINTAVTVSEWFQTTDEQFDTNSLIGVRTSGSDSLELDIAGSNLVGEYGSLDVTNGATTTVSLTNTYTNPVVVASIRYSRSVPDGDQPAARVSSKTGTSFAVYADNFTFDAPGTSTIDYIVMEAGEWLIADGGDSRRVFATSTSVGAIAGSGIPADPGGVDVVFPTAFSAPPAVFTMVTTVNDPQWVVSSVYDGNNISNPPTASQVSLYLNDNLASNGHGSAEDIDMIAFDRGAGTNNTVVFDILNTATDVTDTPNTEPFGATFTSTPQAIVVQQLTMNGTQGGYAMVDIDTPPTTTGVTVSIEEGGTIGARGHAAEQVGIIAFEDALGDIVRTGLGQITSDVIDYDDVVVGNAWGEVSWNDSGDVVYRVQYNTGAGFQNIPNANLPGNTAGFTTSPINILDLDTTIYNELRLVADMSGVGPEVFDWTVTWGQRVEVVELGDPFDNEKTADTTPTFDFVTTDPQGDALDYEISYSTDPTFESGSTTIRSDVTSTDFNGGVAGPYASGATVTYTVPGGSALTNSETYWWRVRAKDPAGGNSFSPWSEPDNFTIDTATSISTWFQTTQAQFQEGVIDGVVASTSNSIELSNEIGEYGTTLLTNNGWTTVTTQLRYNDMVVVASPEYDYDETIDNGRTPQVRNKTRTSFEIKVENATLSLNATTTVHYVVMEAGDWTIEDGGAGTRIIAGTAPDVSAVRGSNSGYTGGTTIDFVPDFSAPPAVFATVATANGSKWVATVLDDGSQQGEVTAADMNIALGVGLDTDTVRVPEDVDYIVSDVTTGDNNGVLFDSLNSPDAITPDEVAVPFNQTFSSLPGVIITHNNANDGGDGGFSLVDPSIAGTATEVYLSIAELPANIGHAPEVVSLLAFESTDGTILRDDSVGGGLAGTIASEPVLFSDGFGPKFSQAVIGATTPGASTVVIQLEYLTSSGLWELIPDGQLAGNSTGFTSATVDLTTVDVGAYQTIRLLGTLSCSGVDCPTLDDWAVEWSTGVDMTGRVFEYDRTTPLSGESAFDLVWIDSVEITIQSANVDADLTDFPVYVDLADLGPAFWSGVQSDGRDIRITTVDGLTEVPYEIVNIDTGSSTGELYFKAPSISDSADTTFYVYFDNVAASAYASTDTYGSQNVWTNDFVAVYHDGGGVDSTAFGRTTTAQGGVTAGNIMGQMGVGTDLNGTTQFFEATGATYLAGLAGFTTSMWIESDAIGNNRPVYNFSTASYSIPRDDYTGLRLDSAGVDGGGVNVLKATVRNTLATAAAGETASNAATTNWMLLHHTWDGTTNQVADVYKDGSLLPWTSAPAALTGTLQANVIAIGRGNQEGYFDGTIDEFRISSTSRSAAWMAAEHTNQSNATSFYATSSATGGVTIVGEIKAAVNGVELAGSGVIQPNGTWTFNNVTAFVGDIVTVWVGSAPDAKEAVSVFKYDGLGDMTGVSLFERHLTLASDETSTTTLADLAVGDNGVIGSEDVFFDVNLSGDLTVCATGTCSDANLYIGESNTFAIGSSANSLEMHDFVNDGVTLLGNNNLLVGGSWDNNNVISIGTSAVTFTSTESEGAPWFDVSWSHRSLVTVNNESIDGTLTDFPVFIDLSDLAGDFFSNVRSDGGDIRITGSDGVTELAREIVAVDTGASTGELHFKAGSLSDSTDTTFYVYYGNAAATDYGVSDTYGAQNVWTNDFMAVYHDGGGTDSTAFGRTTSAQGGVTAGNITGQIGVGTDLDGSTQFFEATGATYLDGLDGFTTSFWMEADSIAADIPVYTFDSTSYDDNGDDFTGLRIDPSGASGGGTNVFKATILNNSAVSEEGETSDNAATTNWMLLHHTWSGTTNQVSDIYKDGSLLAWDFAPAAVTGTLQADVIAIGRGNKDGYFDGTIDEFRVASTSRSAAWMAAEYVNSFNSIGFYTPTISESYTDFLLVGETLDDVDGTVDFYDVTFGESGDDGAWRPVVQMEIARNLSVSNGTLSRDGVPITVAGALTTEANGFWTGTGTTTFDGTGAAAWTDANPVSQNIGRVLVDGAVRTVNVGSDVLATSITIGANDTLNGGGTNDIQIQGNFINNNVFVPATSRLVVTGVATNATIQTNGNNLYALRASSTGGSVAFIESSVTLLDNLEIATGTVTFPTTLLRIGGSLQNTGGTFAHNNAEVLFTGTGSENIQLQGTAFLNAFYDVRFSGTGNWLFTDVNATTSNTFVINSGEVTLPTGQLSVARDFNTNAPGSFIANNGEVLLLIEGNDTVTANGSVFNNVTVRGGSGGALVWYDEDWTFRIPITIRSSEIDTDLTNFPVYVDLSDFDSTNLFDNLRADGGDIRMTLGDELTEVAREVVSASTTAQTGELHFLAPAVSSTTDTVFYLYYGNPAAADYAASDSFGAEGVWVNNFAAIYHLGEDAAGTGNAGLYVDSTSNSFDGDDEVNSAVKTGKVGAGQEILGRAGNPLDDHIVLPQGVLNGRTNLTTSFWMNNSVVANQGIVSAGSGNNYLIWYQPGSNQISLFNGGASYEPLPSISNGQWQHVTVVRDDTANQISFYVNGELIGAPNSVGLSALSIPANCTVIGQEQDGCFGFDTNQAFEGLLDAMTFRDTVSTPEWISANFKNQATTTDFYAVGSAQDDNVRTFANTNVTATGDIVIESGTAVFPTGNFSVGGSFNNDSAFDSNGGTLNFNSTTSAKTIALGISTANNLTFDGVGGGWNITENATATNAIRLNNGSNLTVNSGVTLESTGTFFNAMDNASTTWTGSTLRLSSGNDFSINAKANGGDTYGTLELTGDGDINMWNSTATVYDTADTSSIYSQDHSAVDGDLYIFGDYMRSSGVEYWSYATDFDGVNLSLTTQERQANIRIVNTGSVEIATSSLSMIGSSTASTTVDAQSGEFSLSITNATMTASHFTMTGTDVNGLNLRSSTTVPQFENFEFTIPAGSSAITADASTVDTNPASQYYDGDFVTGGGNVNVTLSGTPNSFWWFRDGAGDRYGESFDNADGDPGSIRWDDSSFSVAVAGVVYSDDGATPLGGPACDGSTNNVRIVVDGGAFTAATNCDGITGAYNFTGVSFIGDPSIVVYLDTDGGENGAVITKTPTGDILDLDIYADRVMTRHEDVSPLTIADMAMYDQDDDADLQFIAATSTTDTLIVRPNIELIVASSTTFRPDGNITLQSSGSGEIFDGSLHIDDSATFIATGAEVHNIGGSFFNDALSTFDAASSTFNFTATTTGKGVTQLSGNTLEFNQLNFTGIEGSWNLVADIAVELDMNIATGTVTGTGDITMNNGELIGNGLLSLGGGTTTILTTTTLGGMQGWTFFDLVLGDGATTSTTTRASTATTTVANQLVIVSGHILDAGSSAWNFAGIGDVIIEDGTLEEGTSTILYSGNGPVNVLQTNYYNLQFGGSVGTPVYAFPITGVLVNNDLTVGGSVLSVVDLNTNDPLVSVLGTVRIVDSGDLSLSGTNVLTISGDYDNDGVLSANSGKIVFDSTDAYTVAAGNSDLADVTLDGAGAVTIVENATSTGLFTIGTSSDFTQQSGTVLAVGGQLAIDSTTTDWTGTTLSLYGGGNYEVNQKGNTENFETLVIGDNTQIRTWDADTVTEVVTASGSWYSQDHATIDGDVYVYGSYVSDTRNDHWSYETDFDGTDISGGNERQADVYLASGASTLWRGGSISVIGTSTASTTVQNQGAGTYSLTVGGNAAATLQTAVIRNIDSNGITFTAAPNVIALDSLDLLVESNGGSAMTVGGTAITASPARTLDNNIFNSDTGVTGAFNVTATGTTLSGWRFTAHSGNLDGEADDNDPAGDPGYVIWDDSAAIISISGNVYESDSTTVSSVCDDSTANIVLAIDGSIAQQASSSCASLDGAYTISGVSFGSLDELMIYIDGGAGEGVTVSKDPISSIADADIYENHVIVRHENTDALTIADMAAWDSSDDADIPYTAVLGTTNTLTLPANNKLLVWSNKDFAPDGNMTITGGGAGAVYDGSVEVLNNGSFVAADNESHTVGGSFELAATADFIAASSTITFTTAGSIRNIEANEDAFNQVVFNGSGSWSIADSNFTVMKNLTVTNGALTLPSGVTTIGGSLVNTDTVNTNNGLLSFVSASPANTVELGGSDAYDILFAGAGSWTMTDVNATTTNSFTVATGTVTLPSGTLVVGQDFVVTDTINNNSGSVLLTSNLATSTLTLSNNDLFSVIKSGVATTTMTDASASLLGNLFITNGVFNAATNTLSIAGSLDASAGVFNTASSTILFNSADTGEFIDPGQNEFYNVVIAGVGGWTITENATTTNNFSLITGTSFAVSSGRVIYVGNVFTNNIGGVDTTWTGSTLVLDGANEYEINLKSTPNEQYENIILGENTDISIWNSEAVTTNVPGTSSFYSQDHASVNGSLFMYGDYVIATTTEYWNYSTDFDGASLTGAAQRQVIVSLANTATTSVTASGALEIIGALGNETIVQHQISGEFNFDVSGGVIDFEYYSLDNMTTSGLNISGSPSINSLSNGAFIVNDNAASAITLNRTALDANASFSILNTSFATASPAVIGINVNLSATSTNSWKFSDSFGGIHGETYDIDGVTNCGSIRWDDSSCLLTEQTEYRWRNNDGGIGVPNGEWFDTDWDKRARVRIANNDGTAYSNATVLVTVAYDADMRNDFDDLRFTLADGVTPIDFWVERVTASISADVWLEVPALPETETVSLFMYYGNVVAPSISSSTATMIAVDDFEDGNISEYSGQTSLFQVDAGSAYGGSFGLELTPANKGTRLNPGIARFDQPVSSNQTIRYRQYVDTAAGPSDESCTLFGVQSPVTDNDNYGVCLELFGVDRISLAKNILSTDSFGSVVQLASSTVAYTTGWYEVEIDWLTDGAMNVSLFDPSGTRVATTSANDTAYTSGGFGFTSWGQNGDWDSFTARTYVASDPTTFFGSEQERNGATYAAAQSQRSSAFTVGDIARLRVAVENTGLDITAQEFTLEFTAKGASPTCSAISGASFATVPINASCGLSGVCMATSTLVANGETTTDLLAIERNTFSAGSFVEDPSSATNPTNVSQNFYTELEYAITVTPNADDQSYCFRVTNDGVSLDSYTSLPELVLAFDPVLDAISLNDGFDIALSPGTTTEIIASTTVTDLNGFADLAVATTTFYKTSVTAACTPDNNNCYIVSDSACSFANCSGNTCVLSCVADFQFHSDPTDLDGGEAWFAFMEVADTAGGVDFGTSIGIELLTLRALQVQNSISYGALSPNANTGSFNPDTDLVNFGNEAIDVQIAGSDMSDGISSVIPAAQQKFSTSTFTYDGCPTCNALSSGGVSVEVDLAKPNTDTPPVVDGIYWGIEVPFGTASNAHTGINTFTAISD